MSEAASRRTFLNTFKEEYPDGDYQRFEDKLTPGIPDINLTAPGIGEWWVEAKYLEHLPALPTTPVRIGLRLEQALWLRKRASSGGKCLVLVRIGRVNWATFDRHFSLLQQGVPVREFWRLAHWFGEELDLPAILT